MGVMNKFDELKQQARDLLRGDLEPITRTGETEAASAGKAGAAGKNAPAGKKGKASKKVKAGAGQSAS